MPYRFEKEKKHIPAEKDRRRKLTEEEIAAIQRNPDGLSQRALAAMYGVSRRTIQFTQDPSKLVENKKRREERGGWKQYYNKGEHADAMRDHRRYKKRLSDSGDLKRSEASLPSKK